jgi:hypothetical protein
MKWTQPVFAFVLCLPHRPLPPFASQSSPSLPPSLAASRTPLQGRFGNRMTPAQIMGALGVTKYKTNPVRPSFDQAFPLVERYAIAAAGELEDWNIGPHCEYSSCRIPYGVRVGNENIPANVFIAFQQAIVTEIDFNLVTYTGKKCFQF